MKLSDLNFGKVEKDGEFNWLGLTAEDYDGKKVLTFLNDEKYYKEIENNKSITCIVTTDEVAKKIEKEAEKVVKKTRKPRAKKPTTPKAITPNDIA